MEIFDLVDYYLSGYVLFRHIHQNEGFDPALFGRHGSCWWICKSCCQLLLLYFEFCMHNLCRLFLPPWFYYPRVTGTMEVTMAVTTTLTLQTGNTSVYCTQLAALKMFWTHEEQLALLPISYIMDQLLVSNHLRISFRHREAHVNHYNAARQHAVNAAAAHYGAGTGTAAHYGVPG